MSAYVNIHGQPLSVSAGEAVRAIEPDAVAAKKRFACGWAIFKSPHRAARLIGTGESEEAAWRDAWSRMLADDIARGGPTA